MLWPGPSPHLLELLGIQVDREQHRRIGVELFDLPLAEAIPLDESVAAAALAIALRDTAPPGRVRGLFAAVTDRLTAGARL